MDSHSNFIQLVLYIYHKHITLLLKNLFQDYLMLYPIDKAKKQKECKRECLSNAIENSFIVCNIFLNLDSHNYICLCNSMIYIMIQTNSIAIYEHSLSL